MKVEGHILTELSFELFSVGTLIHPNGGGKNTNEGIYLEFRGEVRAGETNLGPISRQSISSLRP